MTGQSAGIEVYKPQRILSGSTKQDLLDWSDRCIRLNRFKLLIDLSQVSFLDSMGLGALVRIRGNVLTFGGQFALCSINGQTAMLLQITHMDQIFQIYKDESEAFSAMCGK